MPSRVKRWPEGGTPASTFSLPRVWMNCPCHNTRVQGEPRAMGQEPTHLAVVGDVPIVEQCNGGGP